MKVSIIVQNLKCGGCAKTITSKLTDLDNISAVSVDPESAIVHFTYIVEKDVSLVKKKLSAMGYPSIDSKNTLTSKVISYVSCATGKMIK